jgi:hypothetical protein
MAYIKLTSKGESFIKSVCSGTGNSLLTGNKPSYINDKSSKLYNPDGVLPFCLPKVSASKVWVASPKDDDGNVITTNEDLGKSLIKWYNHYGSVFAMDSNIIAAQGYAESAYKVWIYPLTSTASGISQFIVDAVYDVIVTNKFASSPEYAFTTEEIAAITKGLSGNTQTISTFSVKYAQGKKNRATLHQNVIDNPKIMIKAQFAYMKYISSLCDGLASCTLFGYNRGPGYVSPSYTKSIAKATDSNNYQMEGINYVYKIFNFLGNNSYSKYGYFGYDGSVSSALDLKLKEPFDSYKAEVSQSNYV